MLAACRRKVANPAGMSRCSNALMDQDGGPRLMDKDGAEYGSRVASSEKTLQFFVCFISFFCCFTC